MDYDDLVYEKRDNIAIITLDRPERMNAMTPEMMDGVFMALEEAKQDDEVRVVVLTGAGRGFCSGADVRSLRARVEGGGARSFDRPFRSAAVALYGFTKPTIAMVNGVALGGGFDLALSCDMRIASEDATFSEAFIKLGSVPASGGLYLLPQLVGLAKACELILTGDTIDAREAERIGLVNKVVPAAELEAQTMELATKIAAAPPITARLSKKGIYECLKRDFASSLDYGLLLLSIVQSTEDYKEGVRARSEKRPPVFKGR